MNFPALSFGTKNISGENDFKFLYEFIVDCDIDNTTSVINVYYVILSVFHDFMFTV